MKWSQIALVGRSAVCRTRDGDDILPGRWSRQSLSLSLFITFSVITFTFALITFTSVSINIFASSHSISDEQLQSLEPTWVVVAWWRDGRRQIIRCNTLLMSPTLQKRLSPPRSQNCFRSWLTWEELPDLSGEGEIHVLSNSRNLYQLVFNFILIPLFFQMGHVLLSTYWNRCFQPKVILQSLTCF